MSQAITVHLSDSHINHMGITIPLHQKREQMRLELQKKFALHTEAVAVLAEAIMGVLKFHFSTPLVSLNC